MLAYNGDAPEEQRFSVESDKSDVASLGKPGKKRLHPRLGWAWLLLVL